METKRIVVYLNQFFGQMGGEDKANVPPQSFDQPRGPGVGLQQLLPDNCKVVGTIVCGDGYFNENLEEASAQVREMLTEIQPDVVIAARLQRRTLRYGLRYGGQNPSEMDIPAVSAMYQKTRRKAIASICTL